MVSIFLCRLGSVPDTLEGAERLGGIVGVEIN